MTTVTSHSESAVSEESPTQVMIDVHNAPETKISIVSGVKGDTLPVTPDVKSDTLPVTPGVKSDTLPVTPDVKSDTLPVTPDVKSKVTKWTDAGTYWYLPPEALGPHGAPIGDKFPTDEVTYRISASRLAAALGKSKYPDRTPEHFIEEIVMKTKREMIGNSAQLGNDFQPYVAKWYSEKGPVLPFLEGTEPGNKIEAVGMAVPKNAPYLSAIADGKIGEKEGVEIKTRYVLTNGLITSPDPRGGSGQVGVPEEITEIPNEDYYEMLEQMYCYGWKWTRYIVYSRNTNDVFSCRVPFDEKHWNEFVMPTLAVFRQRVQVRLDEEKSKAKALDIPVGTVNVEERHNVSIKTSELAPMSTSVVCEASPDAVLKPLPC